MISTYASGIVTGTINSEIFLSSPNEPGKYRLYLDIANMVTGDMLEVRRYKMVINSGTSRAIDISTFQGAPSTEFSVIESEEVWNSLVDPNAVRFSVKQTLSTGSAKSYPWSVLKEDVYVLMTGTISASVVITGTVDANVLLWKGLTPNDLVSGSVDANVHYPSPLVADVGDKTGFSLANPQAWDLIGNISGTITNTLNVINPVTAGNVTGSVLGNVNGSVASVTNPVTAGNVTGSVFGNVNGSVGSVVAPVGINTGSFIFAMADQVWDETLAQHLLVGSTGEKLYVTTGSSGGGSDPWLTALPGIYTPGQAGHILASRMPTGTVDANVITWKGSVPNNLISGTVDAFSHYSNPVQANVSITGTVDANVVLWRSTQPNVLISGTVDAYEHYISAGAANDEADALLKRDWTAIAGEASRSVLNALRFIRNKFSTTATPGVVTIYKEDDAAVAYTKSVTTDASADPIVEG